MSVLHETLDVSADVDMDDQGNSVLEIVLERAEIIFSVVILFDLVKEPLASPVMKLSEVVVDVKQGLLVEIGEGLYIVGIEAKKRLNIHWVLFVDNFIILRFILDDYLLCYFRGLRGYLLYLLHYWLAMFYMLLNSVLLRFGEIAKGTTPSVD